MKRILLSLAISATAINYASAQLIKNDFMNGIAIGEDLEQVVYATNTATATLNAWHQAQYADNDGASPKVTAALSYSGYGGTGNSFELVKLTSGTSRTTGYTLTNGTDYSAGSYYLAFLVNIPAGTLNNNFNAFIMFNGNAVSNFKRATVNVKYNDGKVQFGINETDAATTTSAGSYDFDVTHLLIMKYDFTNNKYSLFVNPAVSGSEPVAPSASLNTSSLSSSGIRAITVRQRTSHAMKIGGLRFAKTWVDAIGYEGTNPVNLVGYTAKIQSNGSVNLNWATASETGNDYFLVERSADGSNYSQLEKISSKGESGNYQYTDNQPLNGNNYYRLSQFDKDGKSEILGVQSVSVALGNESGSIYPNPLKGNSLNIKLSQTVNEPVIVTISNIAGKEVYKGTFTSSDINVELASKPAPGVYFVKAGTQQIFKLYVE